MDEEVFEENLNAEEEDKKELKDLMKDHDLDKDEAEHVKEIMDDHGLDEDEAVELKDVL